MGTDSPSARKPKSPAALSKERRRFEPDIFAQIERFTSSGLFFMALGCVFLSVAYHSMASAHANFSFIIVIIGAAVFLFGTGTHAIGRLDGEHYSARYRIQMYGGAGAIALCMAFAVAFFSDKMKAAFGIERKYFVIQLSPKTEAGTHFDKYLAEFRISGKTIPAARSEDLLIAYVPYVQAEVGQIRRITYTLYKIERSASNATLRDRFEAAVDVPVGNYQSNSYFDFPVYSHNKEVDLSSPDSTMEQLKHIQRNDQNPSEIQPNAPPPLAPAIDKF